MSEFDPSRREFIRTGLWAAGSILLLGTAACSGSESDQDPITDSTDSSLTPQTTVYSEEEHRKVEGLEEVFLLQAAPLPGNLEGIAVPTGSISEIFGNLGSIYTEHSLEFQEQLFAIALNNSREGPDRGFHRDRELAFRGIVMEPILKNHPYDQELAIVYVNPIIINRPADDQLYFAAPIAEYGGLVHTPAGELENGENNEVNYHLGIAADNSFMFASRGDSTSGQVTLARPQFDKLLGHFGYFDVYNHLLDRPALSPPSYAFIADVGQFSSAQEELTQGGAVSWNVNNDQILADKKDLEAQGFLDSTYDY